MRRFLVISTIVAPPLFVGIITAMNYRFHWQLPLLDLCFLMSVFSGAVLGFCLNGAWWKRLLGVLFQVVLSLFVSGFVMFYVAGLNGDAM